MTRSILLIIVALNLGACVIATKLEPDLRSSKTTAIRHKHKQTLILPDDAVPAHINHGDSYGACS